MTISKFPVTPYVVRGHFTAQPAEFLKLTGFNPGDCGGYAATWTDDEGFTCICIGWFTEDHTDLVHECGHAALWVAETHGWEPTGCNGEPFCYLLGYLYRTCLAFPRE